MAAATEKREDNQLQIDKLSSSLVETSAKIDKRKVEIKTLGKEIAELYKAINEQTNLRAEDSKDNTQTLADTRAGLAAITAAIEVLQNFYNDPTAFVQKKSQRRGDRDGNE